MQICYCWNDRMQLANCCCYDLSCYDHLLSDLLLSQWFCISNKLIGTCTNVGKFQTTTLYICCNFKSSNVADQATLKVLVYLGKSNIVKFKSFGYYSMLEDFTIYNNSKLFFSLCWWIEMFYFHATNMTDFHGDRKVTTFHPKLFSSLAMVSPNIDLLKDGGGTFQATINFIRA